MVSTVPFSFLCYRVFIMAFKIYHFYAFKALLCFAAFLVEVLCFGADSTLLFTVGMLSVVACGLFFWAGE